MLQQLIDFDRQLFLLLNSAHSPVFDFIMYWLSDRSIWIPMYLGLIYLLYRDNKGGFLQAFLIVLIAVGIADAASVHLFKNVFMRLRPCHQAELEGLVHLVKGKCGGQYGFVSSHAANTFALATSMFLFWKRHRKSLAISLLIWAALVSYSRVYLGVHFPADIAGGALLGAFTAWVVHRICVLIPFFRKSINQYSLT